MQERDDESQTMSGAMVHTENIRWEGLPGAGEMDQFANHLPCKHDDISSNNQCPHKKPNVVAGVCNPMDSKMGSGERNSCRMASLPTWESSRPVGVPIYPNKSG